MQIFGIRFYLAEIISSFGTVCLKPVAEMILMSVFKDLGIRIHPAFKRLGHCTAYCRTWRH